MALPELDFITASYMHTFRQKLLNGNWLGCTLVASHFGFRSSLVSGSVLPGQSLSIPEG